MRMTAARIGLLEHFRMLANFKDREDRASFWPYAALVLGIVMVSGSVMILPLAMRSIEAAPSAAQPMPAGFLAAYLCATLGLAVLLYAAAVVRRLHDRGMSGAWGLMPLPFLACTSILVPRLFGATAGGEPPDPALFLIIAVSNILYWAALLVLVVLLAGASDPGPNRYDPGD